MSDEYTVVGKFLSPSHNPGEAVSMVIIQDKRGACVMSESEWKWIQDKQYRNSKKQNKAA